MTTKTKTNKATTFGWGGHRRPFYPVKVRRKVGATRVAKEAFVFFLLKKAFVIDRSSTSNEFPERRAAAEHLRDPRSVL